MYFQVVLHNSQFTSFTNTIFGKINHYDILTYNLQFLHTMEFVTCYTESFHFNSSVSSITVLFNFSIIKFTASILQTPSKLHSTPPCSLWIFLTAHVFHSATRLILCSLHRILIYLYPFSEHFFLTF